jgi:hypothetical protein
MIQARTAQRRSADRAIWVRMRRAGDSEAGGSGGLASVPCEGGFDELQGLWRTVKRDSKAAIIGSLSGWLSWVAIGSKGTRREESTRP